jgi:hypothetical protein
VRLGRGGASSRVGGLARTLQVLQAASKSLAGEAAAGDLGAAFPASRGLGAAAGLATALLGGSGGRLTARGVGAAAARGSQDAIALLQARQFSAVDVYAIVGVAATVA